MQKKALLGSSFWHGTETFASYIRVAVTTDIDVGSSASELGAYADREALLCCGQGSNGPDTNRELRDYQQLVSRLLPKISPTCSAFPTCLGALEH